MHKLKCNENLTNLVGIYLQIYRPQSKLAWHKATLGVGLSNKDQTIIAKCLQGKLVLWQKHKIYRLCT